MVSLKQHLPSMFSAEVPGGVGKLQMLNTNDQVDEAIPRMEAKRGVSERKVAFWEKRWQHLGKKWENYGKKA